MAKDDLQESQHSAVSSNNGEKKKVDKPMASVSETLGFIFETGTTNQALFATGVIAGIGNGLVYPILAYLFSSSFSDISAASSEGLKQVRELAYTFMIVGAYALACATVQTWCFELCAYHGSHNLKLKWFKALLRQDQAFFDVNDVGGTAAQVGSNANKYRRGTGRKMGEGIQFGTTAIGGIGFALYTSWRVALVVLAIVPFIAVAGFFVVSLNQTKGTRAVKSYKVAGSVAYSAVSNIKTVFSLNAVSKMIAQYQEATQLAFKDATSILIKQGLANGSMLGSFLMLYAVLCLYGTSLLYKDVEETGCDPSDGVIGNEACDNTGPDVFGAMLGIAFAAQGISKVGNFFEAFTGARVSVYEAFNAIRRVPGSEQEVIFKEEEIISKTQRSAKSSDVEENREREIKAILPKYEIDVFSKEGIKPETIRGDITVNDVHFTYPTRPDDPVLRGLNVNIKAGQIVAFVGPSGGGKSTIVSLVERFYDPQSGSVEIDGINIKDYNVSHLRSLIGLINQEPTLFACSIRDNIQYGNPSATQEEIEAAAKMANAHDFIMSFTDGYDTQVGDKGGQLSGGQKQRIAIARILVGNPRILLLDEATSALDAESELVVQDALDNILQQKKITTIIIAHRLSTIRNADVINVIQKGVVVENGTHDELMAKASYYKKLVDKQEGHESSGTSPSSSRVSSSTNLANLDSTGVADTGTSASLIHFKNVSFAYPTRPKKKIFNDFSLAVEKGETIALVGGSGGGKSTTVGLIERFYDVDEGSIEYMGHDIRSLNVHWYRDQIGYVGQEPALFNCSIAENIAYGAPNASRSDIEEAAKQANAHDFIMSFPEGYDTLVGERGTQLSGGQKQRVAIARALVKKPEVLILDEATSALDNESESIVQAAIDELMVSSNHTVILIAHRLSTIRNADRIAFVGEGKVLELGTHEELIAKENGRFKRLFESSKRSSTLDSVSGLRASTLSKATTDVSEEEDDTEKKEGIDEFEELEKKHFDSARARGMAGPDKLFLLVGSIGAVMAGGVFPMWGVLFAETIELLFRRVEVCEGVDDALVLGFDDCDTYFKSVADAMQDRSYRVSGFWAIVMFGCLIGEVLLFWGFGTASERLNKRIRDSSFTALLRQEVAYFDKRSVGSITSRLQDDAARIHAFSGEPVRSMIVALSSVFTGLVLSFIFMWQFALLAIGCVPLMGFATSMEMKNFLGEDEGTDEQQDEKNSPGGIIVESLVNIRTVAALTLQEERYKDYSHALEHAEPNHSKDGATAGFLAGLSMFIQQWINALQLWFGGWLLFNFPEYEFKDFLIANFSILFALFGLGAAFQDISDKKEVELSAGRIFYLLDRKSSIDPLSTEGKKLD